MVRYDPEQFYMLSKPVDDEYSDTEELLFALLLAELLADGDVSVDEWVLIKRNNKQKFTDKVQTIINRTTKRVATKANKVLNAVEVETNKQVGSDIKSIGGVVSNQTITSNDDELLERLKRAITTVNGSMLWQMQEEYLNQVDKVYKELANTEMTLEKAVRKSMKPVAKDGIVGYYDNANKRWKVDVYMRTVMRNTIKMKHNQQRLDYMLGNDIELVVVSEHAGSRPSHYHYQNKVYSLKRGHPKYPYIGETGVGEPAGLLGVNCRHFLMPYMEDMRLDQNQYTADENEQMYEYLQQQRDYERRIREAKRMMELYDKTGDKVVGSKYRKRSRQLGKELQATIDKANSEYDSYLRRQRDRERNIVK